MHYPDDKPIAVITNDIPSPEHVTMPTIDSPSSKKSAGTPNANLTYAEQQKKTRKQVRSQGVTAPTALSENRKNWGTQRGEVSGGAANFYKEVKVCGVCAQVYGLLDQSRELLYLEEEKKFEEEKIRQLSDYTDHRDYRITKDHKVSGHHEHATEEMGEEGGGEKGIMSTRLGRELFSLSLNNPLGLDDKTMPPSMESIDESTDGLDTTFLSPVKTKNGKAQFANSMRSPSLPKPRATWKDHVKDDDEIGEHFQKIEDSSSNSSKKRRKTKNSKKTPKKSAAQQVVAKGNDPHFEVLDDYLKGTKRLQHTVHGRKQSQLKGGKETQDRLNNESNRYHAKILIGGADKESAMRAKEALEPSGYIVNWVENGADCVEMMQETHYDAILVARDMAVLNSFDVAKWTRDREKTARVENAKLRAQQNMTMTTSFNKNNLGGPDKVVVKPDLPPLPIIIYTDQVKPEDLQLYMEAGMDGCVSKPLHPPSLVSTFKSAISDHLQPLLDVLEARGEIPKRNTDGEFEPTYGPKTRIKPRAFITGAMGTVQGDDGSSAMVANTMALSTSFSKEDYSNGGVIQYDSDTKFPYIVLDSTQYGTDNTGAKMFNMVVCHDIFDTCERLKIVLKDVVLRYPGIQILLWNYPGQAFTDFREGQTLNNDYHAGCLYELLEHVGSNGTGQFNTQKPYYMMGYGNGASIASFFAAHYKTPFLRSLLYFNGFSFVDPHYAAIMHDCMNVFSCSPDTRPDLPVYFYARFIFSPSYLSSVSTPLALNLYTAVHNPITTHGRIQLCLGALSHTDIRPFLKEISAPIITVHGSQAGLAKPFHAQPFVESRPGGEARSIYQCLKANKQQTCVIWVKGGHELFQEQRKNVTTLIEQLLTGYHELNEVAFMSEQTVEPGGAIDIGPGGAKNVTLGGSQSGSNGENFEDHFVNDLVGQVKKASVAKRKQVGEAKKAENLTKRWENFRETKRQDVSKKSKGSPEKTGKDDTKKEVALDEFNMPGTVTDPTHPSFERQDNIVYKAGNSLMYPNPEQFPEVKEYMSWRLKRNKKRLVRLEHAAKVVQGAFRAHLAWIIVKRLREEQAAGTIQRAYRGFLGRLEFLQKMKELWAAQVIQRTVRGYLGRTKFKKQREFLGSQVEIARIWRGALARWHTSLLIEKRNRGATAMQGLWRKRQARKFAFKRRIERNAVLIIQRIYRGHLGRRRAAHERDKYLFSRSQSSGIEFGRQMLLEHKLHATRLQSDVSLLNQEKVATEERVEALLEEISEFEEGVRSLEREMHQLSKVETEASGVLDDVARQELRDQKMRLDREFGTMLTRIADRKDQLKGLEGKLGQIDRNRQSKEEELRVLERKLVVLLEEQQLELGDIRRRQERKGEALLNGSGPGVGGKGEGGAVAGLGAVGGYSGGPTAHDKKQAAQLMQSTETLMKFGFMSMSMTYFSSLNMVRAMRTVAATDTVMAAVANKDDGPMLEGGGGGGGGGGRGGGGIGGMGGGGEEDMSEFSSFKPDLQPGKMPGQQDLRVQAWSVSDVTKWLGTLSLGQYRETFKDGAVDGAFLYALTDDDLRNTLGVEHRLHRKKILFSIEELKRAEAVHDEQMKVRNFAEQAQAFNSGLVQDYRGQIMSHGITGAPGGEMVPFGVVGEGGAGGGEGGPFLANEEGHIPLNFSELSSWVRHQKYKKLKQALDQIPNKYFDPSVVKVQYIEHIGTA